MAKRKPDKVIEYRISLQDKERELLEHLVYVEGTAKAFNQFTEPFVEIVKDISAMTLIFGALAAYGGWTFVVSPGIDSAEGIYADFMALLDAVNETREAAGEAAAYAGAYLTPAWLRGLQSLFGGGGGGGGF